jgi:hypothetical protein
VIEASGTVTFTGPLTLANGAQASSCAVAARGVRHPGRPRHGRRLLEVSGMQATGGAGSLHRHRPAGHQRRHDAGQAVHIGTGAGPAG